MPRLSKPSTVPPRGTLALATFTLAALTLAGCAFDPSVCTRDAGKALTPSTMVSGQTPAGVYGVSNPGAGYQPANSFPPGAATVDARCL